MDKKAVDLIVNSATPGAPADVAEEDKPAGEEKPKRTRKTTKKAEDTAEGEEKPKKRTTRKKAEAPAGEQAETPAEEKTEE